MNLNKQQDIEKQLKEISDLSMPVSVIIDNTIAVAGCRLMFTTGCEKELLIQVTSGDYPQTGELAVTCTHPRALYKFKSNIVSQKDIYSKDSLYFAIRFPEVITQEERRKYFRIKPSEANPIQIRLAVPDSDVVNVGAMDIGRGGISFAVPKDINRFSVGDSLYMDINLPACDWLSALVIVKNIAVLQDMVRIGAGFSRVSEDVYKMIMEYVAGKTREESI